MQRLRFRFIIAAKEKRVDGERDVITRGKELEIR